MERCSQTERRCGSMSGLAGQSVVVTSLGRRSNNRLIEKDKKYGTDCHKQYHNGWEVVDNKLDLYLWRRMMDEQKLLERITVNPNIFGGKPIIRGRRLAVEHLLGMLAAGDSIETILERYV